MLTEQNMKLLEELEAQYVTMPGVAGDVARIDMGDTPEQNELGK
jgi:hypothetical protein